ncbi:hypothetical protein D9Q98_000036 [Chlorella vulgaris]|uniref:Uncharacterized protein n=1 Tax=Chlorella vulgaris TaxID=3077 RepID=A0A9D4TXF5_CHLVU|nr:hypothetical protein D9Q98_000036 [Chlorella vulgaris]
MAAGKALMADEQLLRSQLESVVSAKQQLVAPLAREQSAAGTFRTRLSAAESARKPAAAAAWHQAEWGAQAALAEAAAVRADQQAALFSEALAQQQATVGRDLLEESGRVRGAELVVAGGGCRQAAPAAVHGELTGRLEGTQAGSSSSSGNSGTMVCRAAAAAVCPPPTAAGHLCAASSPHGAADLRGEAARTAAASPAAAVQAASMGGGVVALLVVAAAGSSAGWACTPTRLSNTLQFSCSRFDGGEQAALICDPAVLPVLLAAAALDRATSFWCQTAALQPSA